MRAIYPDSEPLGIMVCARPGHPPFAESPYLHKLIRTGKQMGLRVIVFDPRTWNPDDNSVQGWTLREHEKDWRAGRSRLPSLIYDRSWPPGGTARSRFRDSSQLMQAQRKPRFLNASLPSKQHVHAMLSRDPELSRLLVPTAPYGGPASLRAWLSRHEGAAFLKPSCGSQGKRTVAWLSLADDSVRLRGRDADNRAFDRVVAGEEEAAAQLHGWIGNRAYLMQPYLDLTVSGAPYDIRALVQKNGRGRWTLTGAAARVGAAGTVTSNLHGGGVASPAGELLASLYGAAKSRELMTEIRRACLAIVRQLERFCGHFCELGLDFGVERGGKLRFLEANSKPGRSAMAGIDSSSAAKAVARPLAYAKSILLRPPGRVIHEFDHL